MKAYRSEKGQAIVLIVLALVALVAFAGLAVDGGRVFSERRRAQNAADAAAFAAASAALQGNNFSTAAFSLALANGFDNDASTNWVTVSHPPASGVYGPASALPLAERNKYYQVTITQDVDPVFSQIFYGGVERVTVEAIAMADGITPFSGTNALMSLQSIVGETGFVIDGNATITIHGGNTWSNNNGIKNGNAGDVNVYTSYDESTYGNYYYVGSWPAGKRKQMNGNFTPALATMGVPSIPQPYCPSGAAPKTETWSGVKYYKRSGGSLPATLSPGVWCITGELNSNTVGTDVLVVLLDSGIKYTGNGNLQLTRDSDLIDKNGNQFGGLVIYAPLTNTNTFRFGGNSESLFNGTVFAPGMECDFGGTPANKSNHTAIICDTIKIHGNPTIDITYIPEQNYRIAPSLDLTQ